MLGPALAILLQASAAALPEKLDCAPGYEASLERIRRLPDARAQAAAPGAPFGVIEDRASITVYTYTLPGASGHSAIVKRQLFHTEGRWDMSTSGCGWGDKAGFDELMRQFEAPNRQIVESLRRGRP